MCSTDNAGYPAQRKLFEEMLQLNQTGGSGCASRNWSTAALGFNATFSVMWGETGFKSISNIQGTLSPKNEF